MGDLDRAIDTDAAFETWYPAALLVLGKQPAGLLGNSGDPILVDYLLSTIEGLCTLGRLHQDKLSNPELL